MKRGYLVTIVGATTGALAGGFGLGALAAYIAIRTQPDDGWTGLMEAVIFGTVGVAVGTGVGSWLVLRLKSYDVPGATAVVGAIVGTAALWASIFITEWLCRDSCVGPFDRQGTVLFIGATGFAGAVLGARWLAVFGRLWVIDRGQVPTREDGSA